MQQQKLNLKIRGLWLHPNPFSEVPDGALVEATNIVIDRESIAEVRRGQYQYGNTLPSAPDKLYNYRNTMLVHYDNKLAYDSGNGAWTTYAANCASPSSDTYTHAIEANRNIYFTSNTGILKLDSVTSNLVSAGVPQGLDGTGSTTGTSGWFTNNTVVGYRVVWGYYDKNNNLILGSPSQPITISNSSGGTRNTILTFTIPAEITTSYYYYLYRSPMSVDLNTSPSDEMQLVIQSQPTSAEITAKSVTVTDATPDDLKGAYIYTAPSQEGIIKSNEMPPFAKDIDVFRGYVFYANCKSKQRLLLNLVGSGYPSLTANTNANANTTISSTQIKNLGNTGFLVAGMRVKHSAFPSNTRIVTIDSGTQVTVNAAATTSNNVATIEFQDIVTVANIEYYAATSTNVSANEFKVTSSGTPADNIEATSLDLIRVVNGSPINSTIYAYYLSGFTELPGKLLFQERSLGGSTFYATSTRGGSFNPVLPTSGTTVASDNDEKQNRIYISKYQQPEAVPLLNALDVGSANFPIRRIVSLRDSVFVFKDDGIFRITGETTDNFSVSLFESTAIIRASETAIAFSNKVYVFTDQGIVAVDDGGVAVVSRPIELTLLELSSSEYPGFADASFAVAYEAERKYIFYTVTNTSDTYATQAFVYNTFTNTWTRWSTARSCGIVNRSDDKLYTGHPVNLQVYKERKTFTANDYADEEYPVTITGYTGSTLTVSDASQLQVDMTLQQVSTRVIITSVDLLTDTITVDAARTWNIAAPATAYAPIDVKLQFTPIDVGNPALLKQFQETTLLFDDARFNSMDVGFSTNFSRDPEYTSILTTVSGGWGSFRWGTQPWGTGGLSGALALRTFVPLEKQRALWLNVALKNKEAFTPFGFQGLSVLVSPMSTRFR